MKTKERNLEIAKFLLDTCKKAWKSCLKLKMEVVDKGTHDLVTTLDTSLEKVIIKLLHKKFPDVKIVSEEFNSSVEAKGTFFTIDPIDGTINFANKIDGMWGMQISYVEDDVVTACAIYKPNGDEYYAGKGCGSYKNGKRFYATKRSPIHSVIAPDIKDIDVFYKVIKDIEDKIMKWRMFGAGCVNGILMAEGKLGGFIQFAANVWDLNCGFLLIEEAGCLRKDLPGYYVFATKQETLDMLEKAVLKATKKETKKKKDN